MNEKLTLISENSDGENEWHRHFVKVNDGTDSGKAADANVVKERLVSQDERELDDRILSQERPADTVAGSRNKCVIDVLQVVLQHAIRHPKERQQCTDIKSHVLMTTTGLVRGK